MYAIPQTCRMAAQCKARQVVADTCTEIITVPHPEAGTKTCEWYTEKRRRGNLNEQERRKVG